MSERQADSCQQLCDEDRTAAAFRIDWTGSADGFEGENAELDSCPLGGAGLEKGSCRGCALFSAEASPGISVPAAARQPDGGRE